MVTPAVRHSAETVGCAFTSQYYQVLDQRPEDAHKFYKDSSFASWEGKDGLMHSVTTMEGINEMILSSDYIDCEVQVDDVSAQDSLHGSILLVVTGNLTGEDKETRKFSHTFLLARQERGFFVLNDILRLFDMPPPTPKESESPPATVSEVVEVSENKATQTEPVISPSYAQIITESVPKPSASSTEIKHPIPAKSSYLETLSKECPQIPATQVVRVSANDSSSGEPKPQAPDAIKRAVSHSNSVSKAYPTPPSDETTDIISNGVYVGGLPPNTTKQELAEAMKIFGRVKKDAVQVVQDNKNEDGFTYGFVHFESEESAQKAVEAHNVNVRGKDAYILYKKSNPRGGNNGGRGRSPPARGGFRHGPSPPKARGSSNGSYHNRPENGGAYYQQRGYRNRSFDGQDTDGYYQWKGRRGISSSHGS